MVILAGDQARVELLLRSYRGTLDERTVCNKTPMHLVNNNRLSQFCLLTVQFFALCPTSQTDVTEGISGTCLACS